MFTVKKLAIVVACAAFSLLISACQPPAANPATPVALPESVTVAPTPDDLMKGTLSYGEGQLGNLAGEDEFWAFEGQKGDLVDISMVSASADMDPTFSLIGPSNELLHTVYSDVSDVNYEANLKCYELPETGRYVVVASTYHADLMAGSYILTVQSTSQEGATEPTPLALGEIAQNLGCGQQVDTWVYEGEASQMLWVQITPDYDVDENAELSADLDVQIEGPSGDESVTTLGQYFVEAEEWNGVYVLGESGEVVIRVEQPQGDDTQPFVIGLYAVPDGGYYYGGSTSGMQFLMLSYPGIGILPIDAGRNTGSVVTISSFTPDYQQCGELPVKLMVIGPEGDIVASTSDSETVALENVPVSPEGTAYFPMGESETYRQLKLEQVALTDAGRYWVAVVSLSAEPTWPDDCAYYGMSIEYLEQ